MRALVLLVLLLAPVSLAADEPLVLEVHVAWSGAAWRFDVTVAHDDSGWEHYVDGWEVTTPDGTRLGYRELRHPHELEQPFTRSLDVVSVSVSVTSVLIRAHDNRHGWGEPVRVELPR
jgi:hypothetical protein